jgi:hypothetical protein
MQLIPRALVLGAFLPPNMPGMGGLDAAKINRIWSELAPRHHFTQLQMSPDGAGANFVGPSAEDGVTIQLPLIQVRSAVQSTTEEAGRDAQAILGVISKYAGAPQLFNLGIRLIYAAPLPTNDARGFVLHQLLNNGADHVEQLGGLPDQSWGGVKYVIPQPDRQYTVAIEPAQMEQMRSLYIDVDTAFPPGPFDLEGVAARVEEVKGFLSGPLNDLLDATAT